MLKTLVRGLKICALLAQINCSAVSMHKITLAVIFSAMLLAGFGVCSGDVLPLSIIKSNDTVILTWPQTSGGWLLVETPGLDYFFVTNGVVYKHVYGRTTIPSASYSTNGANISV